MVFVSNTMPTTDCAHFLDFYGRYADQSDLMYMVDIHKDLFEIGTMMGSPKPNIPDMERIGSLYCLDKDGSLRNVVQGIGISNGLAWSSDGKSMYYIDSSPRQMYKYDFDPSTGKIGNLTLSILLFS